MLNEKGNSKCHNDKRFFQSYNIRFLETSILFSIFYFLVLYYCIYIRENLFFMIKQINIQYYTDTCTLLQQKTQIIFQTCYYNLLKTITQLYQIFKCTVIYSISYYHADKRSCSYIRIIKYECILIVQIFNLM